MHFYLTIQTLFLRTAYISQYLTFFLTLVSLYLTTARYKRQLSEKKSQNREKLQTAGKSS